MSLISNASIFAIISVFAVYFYQRFATGKATSVIVQALHYLARQHVAPSKQHLFAPFTLPSAWNGTYMSANPHIWSDILTEKDTKALTHAIHHFQSTKKSMEQMTTDDFPLPADLAAKVASWRHQLSGEGRGFQLIRGVPVDQWSLKQSEIFFFALGKYLGIPGAQDNNGTLLGHVKSIEVVDNKERPYRQTVDIAYHCDGSDVVGLLCIHPAKDGGISRIISSVSVFNRLLLTHTNSQPLAAKLFSEVFLANRATFGMGLKFLPITPLKVDSRGVLRTYWNQEYFLRAYRRANGSVTTMGEQDPLGLAAVEAYDFILARDMQRGQINRGNCSSPPSDRACFVDPNEGDELGMDMALQAGDIQLVSNHFVLHARTEFNDYSDEEIADANKIVDGEGQLVSSIGKRELLRLWLSHPNSDLTWGDYLSKQIDLLHVLAGVARAFVLYR